MRKALGFWPPREPYRALRRALGRGGDVSGLPQLLREYPDAVRWEKKGDMSPLDYTLWQGNTAAAEILIEHDASILHDTRQGGVTLLHQYARDNNEARLLFLIRQGADVNKPDAAGRTPLHYAAQELYSGNAAAHLLKYGARNDARDAKGRTPLLIALASRHKTAVTALMKKPFDPRQCDNSGRTLLMAAAEGGMADVVLPLLAAGADIAARSSGGKTALDVAIDKKSAQVALKLLEAELPAALEDKRRKKLGNLIRPLEGSEAALRSMGLRPSPKKKAAAPPAAFKPF